MTERLSDADLDRLDKLAVEATPGPWEADVNEVSQAWSRPEPWLPVVSTEVSCMNYCYGGSARGVEEESDAEFIAAARTAIPALLAEVRAAREREAAVRTHHLKKSTHVLTGECAVAECGHEDECPTVPFDYCTGCNEIAEHANPYYAENGMQIVSWPCATIRALGGVW